MAEKILATRPATENDFEYVWRVYSEAVKPHIAPHLKNGWDDAVEVKNFHKIWKPTDSHIITVDGTSVGWGAIIVSENEVRIEHLYIEQAHRGKGYGTRLVSEMTKRWSEKGKAVRAPVLKDQRLMKWASRFGTQVEEPEHSLTQTFTYTDQK